MTFRRRAPIIQSAQSRALDKCVKTAVGQCKSKLPGDKNKDFDYTVKSKITSVYLYVVPEYVMGYKYKNTAYELGVYFSENAPSAREIPDYTPVRNKEIYDKNKALDTVSITVSVLCSILAVLSMLFDIMQILFWTALSLAVAGTALFACAENRHVKTAETVSAQITESKIGKSGRSAQTQGFRRYDGCRAGICSAINTDSGAYCAEETAMRIKPRTN